MEETLPEIPELDEKDQKIKDLNKELEDTKFFANQINFNSIMYKSLAIMFDKLTKIEDALEKLTENAK